MFETTSSQIFNNEALQLVQPSKFDAARPDVAKREANSPASGEDRLGRSGSHRLPHQVGLLRVSGDARLLQAVAYIHQHLEDPIGVQELVSHVGVSRRWLEYAFRDALGETPYQYIRRQRLEHAGRLLEEEPNSRIYQIALRTGFNSAKQLTMAFRQHFGLSPRDYRRKLCG